MSWFVGWFPLGIPGSGESSRVESGGVEDDPPEAEELLESLAGLLAHTSAHMQLAEVGGSTKTLPVSNSRVFFAPFFRVVPSRTVQLGSLDLFGLVVVSSFYLAH